MKCKLIVFVILFVSTLSFAADKKEVKSPDGTIKVVITSEDEIRYAVYYKGVLVVFPSLIDLIIEEKTKLTDHLQVRKVTFKAFDSMIFSPVPEKRKEIRNHYNEISIQFKQPFILTVRAYNDGIAYRWETLFTDSIRVSNEVAEFTFKSRDSLWYSPVSPRAEADAYHTSFEEPYKLGELEKVPDNDLIFTPSLLKTSSSLNIVITESDLEDYPGMFLKSAGKNKLRGDFARYPLEEKVQPGEFSQYIVTKRAGFIAKTAGRRTFPWRVFLIAAEDKELPSNDLVYRLAKPSKVIDASWIKPGRGTDEWIIGINLFNIPFKAGINTATYKYYIDFAKKFGLDRIMMDAGWSDNNDLFKINSNINMEELADYAKQSGIKLSMWTLAMTLDKQLERALDQFNKWGVDFIMTDFIDRDDQKTVNFYTKIAEACARHKIMVMYHGAYKPAGFNRTWPNAVTRESVLGSEYNVWSEKATPEHNLQLPFIRMTSGPLDYEPGLLDNASQKTFKPIPEKVMSQGTRCHQLAMFVVYDSPVQFFSGNPSQGLLEPDFMKLLGSIPSTWDQTLILKGKIGDYIITARKKGNDWYVGGMTDWTAREMVIDLGFLGKGTFTAKICQDGINADRYASDYTISQRELSATDKVKIPMAQGGGFMMRLQKKQ